MEDDYYDDDASPTRELNDAPTASRTDILSVIPSRRPRTVWDSYTLENALQETKGDAAHRTALVTGTSDLPLLEALQRMATSKVDALPIIAKSKKAVKKATSLSPNFTAILTSTDVTDYVLRGGDLTATVSDVLDALNARPPEVSLDYVDATVAYTLRDIAVENFLWMYTPLRRGEQYHGKRVYTVDSSGNLVDVMTELDMTKMINVYPPLLNDVASMSVLDLWGQRDLVTVRDTVSALDAFRVMRAAMLTGIPVVDSYGVLLADLSVSDITGVWTGNAAALLNMSVIDFIRSKNNNEFKYANITPTTCLPTATVRDAMGKKCVARHHRLYIAEQRKEGVCVGFVPVGIVALNDVLHAVFQGVA